MTSKVEKSIEVEAPLQRVYNQWTQFEQFPQFMAGVEQVKQLSDTMLHWVAKIAGVRREWDARILGKVPNRKVAWAATTGTTNAGSVYFEPIGPDRTGVRLVLEYDPEGFLEKVGDWLNIVSRQAQADLDKFKQFIESSGTDQPSAPGSQPPGPIVAAPTSPESRNSPSDAPGTAPATDQQDAPDRESR
jgi:uncharacterized membrane protein